MYNSEHAGFADDFIIEFVNSLERIKAYPQPWQPFTQDTRRCQLRRFPYGIAYQLLETEILVAAIAHLHREPGHRKDKITPKFLKAQNSLGRITSPHRQDVAQLKFNPAECGIALIENDLIV